MTITYNITEAKNQLSSIGKQVKKGDTASVLKNGKPFFYIISPDEIEKYEEWKEQERQRQWAEGLDFMEISEEESKSIAEARKEAKNLPSNPMTAKELMDFLSEE